MSYLRLATFAAVLLVLAGTHWRAYVSGERAGADKVQSLWDAERARTVAAALAEMEKRRIDEQALTANNEKVRNENLKAKTVQLAAGRATDNRVRQLEAALASARRAIPDDPPARPGANADPRLDIIAECGRAVGTMGATIKELERKTIGLQSYASTVCVAPK